MSWWLVLALGGGSYILKAVGPLFMGERTSGEGLTRVAMLLTPALLAALIAVQTFGDGRSLVIDARAAGLAVGALAVWKRAPFIVVVVLAAAAAAAVRALSWPNPLGS